MNIVILLLGSNLGNRKEQIIKALNTINQEVGQIIKKTELLETSPEDYKSENYYLNMGITISTNLSPIQLLKSLKQIENNMGRTQDSSISGKYEDRLIDIDIVYFNNLNFISKKLTIPHFAHATKREFSQKILNLLR